MTKSSERRPHMGELGPKRPEGDVTGGGRHLVVPLGNVLAVRS